MSIIVVNISKNVGHMSVINATRRAWKINLHKVRKCKYAVGVSNGSIIGHFNLHSAFVDRHQPDRVAFKLSTCNRGQIRIINTTIGSQNLYRFTVKYIP